MKFVRVNDLFDGVEPLSQRLVRELNEGKHVLWLVPGGSNIPLVVKVMAALPDDLTKALTIMLTDERYGEVGHADSNTCQLLEAGFDPKQAAYIAVLHDGLSLEETARHYASDFGAALSRAEVVIGHFGMGADGHIAGILPGSPAVRAGDLAWGYDAGNFLRLTLTPKALTSLNCAYVFAFNETKRPALRRLRDETLPLDEQPAQILRQIPESYVYNDQFDAEGNA